MELLVCPKCQTSEHQKSGFARGDQRWQCKGCGYQFTRTTPRGLSLEQQLRMVKLYLSGVSFQDCQGSHPHQFRDEASSSVNNSPQWFL